MSAMTIYRFQGLRLVLDTDDDTWPAMVYTTREGLDYSAPWDYATETGVLDCDDCDGGLLLTLPEMEWLDSPANRGRVDAAFAAARAHWTD